MIIAGVDEVGRGAFAGPLVAGCVILESNRFSLSSKGFASRKDENLDLIKINDSKKLTLRQRETANLWIRENALSFGIGKVSSKYIDRYGLTKSTHKAFRMALRDAQSKLDKQIEVVFLDAFYLPYTKGLSKEKQFAFKKGDSKSKSIAAASIIAKVYRDKIMIQLNKQPKYKKYEWDKNKGYGTSNHRNIIASHGLTPYHRKSFIKD